MNSPTSPNPPTRKLVLIVDDEPDFAEPMAALLDEGLGVRTISSFDPLDALRALDAERPDVVISDYQMPNLNGIEFLREVERRRPGMPSILITGNQQEVEALTTNEVASLLGVLGKPVSWRIVAALIRAQGVVA